MIDQYTFKAITLRSGSSISNLDMQATQKSYKHQNL